MTTFYRRRLPHLHGIGWPLFLTWRLFGSLPNYRAFAAESTGGKAFLAMDSLLDQARSGPVYLHQPEIAGLAAEAFRHGENQMSRYDLHAWVIMPNHVHLLITPQVEVPKITHSIKRFTAQAANKILGLVGRPFWQDESYDHRVKDRAERDRIAAYVHTNPVHASLAAEPEDFRWSSAKEAHWIV